MSLVVFWPNSLQKWRTRLKVKTCKFPIDIRTEITPKSFKWRWIATVGSPLPFKYTLFKCILPIACQLYMLCDVHACAPILYGSFVFFILVRWGARFFSTESNQQNGKKKKKRKRKRRRGMRQSPCVRYHIRMHQLDAGSAALSIYAQNMLKSGCFLRIIW